MTMNHAAQSSLSWPPTRPLIVGILNVTPDSFSDGGQYDTVATAVEQAKQMIQDGADWIDVGGESTRPGAAPVSTDQQIQRVVPVIQALAALTPSVPISIDTNEAIVAKAAIDAGASMINDIQAGQKNNDAMLKLAAKTGLPIILMHMRGDPQTMQQLTDYDAIVDDVIAFLKQRTQQAIALGVAPQQLAVDPGIGFAKNTSHNLQLLANLSRLVELDYPVMLGTSRKRCLREITQSTDQAALDQATAITSAIGAAAGALLFRVHNVAINRQAVEHASCHQNIK